MLVALPAVAAMCAAEWGPDNLPPEVHAPVMSPVPDGIQLEIPKELGNRELAQWGFLDVTAAPFFADPSGKKDSTTALQRAIEFARDAQMVCYFPSGDYRVSDTLLLRHGIHMRSHRATFINNLNMPCVLVGAGGRGRRRPRIVLADNAPGFDDPRHPKYVIEHQQYDVQRFNITPNRMGGGASLMNTMVVGLDIVIGRDNPGAVGMHIRSCEGSAVQDMTIDATGGLAGLAGATGNGGSWTNVTIIGGRIGIDMRGWTPPTPTMEGITLLRQTEAAIVAATRGPLTAVGVKVVSQGSGPVIRCEEPWGAFDGGLNLVDSEISFERRGGQPVVAIDAKRSIYLSDVFVRGADQVVADTLPGDPEGWVHVRELAAGKVGKHTRNYALSAPIYLDGRKVASPYIDARRGETPPADLESRHVWGDDFPRWDQPGVANVRLSPYNARGDSFADDTDALQRAIDENEVVFLPKGYYRLRRTLRLRPNTKLIGVGQHLSVIMARDPDHGFAPDGRPGPLVETADTADAETVLAFIGIRPAREVAETYSGHAMPAYSLEWSCGGRSFLRSCDVNPLLVYGFIGGSKHKQAPLDGPAVWITGHGGGRWYNYHAGHHFMPTTQRSRAILIDGASGPLWFYNFEPQGGEGDAVAEIRDSRHVSIFGCKTECSTTFLRVRDSDHVRIIGHGGIGNAARGGALYEVARTPNFLLANLADQANLKERREYYAGHGVHLNIESFFPLRVMQAGFPTLTVPSLERPVLVRWGQPLAQPAR